MSRREYGFDLSGRRTSVTTPEGSSQTFAYDASGNLTRTTDSMGYTTRFQTDAWGRVTLVTRADGSHERYTYDHAGNILTATDGEGHTASYAYNCRGLLSSRTDAMGASEHFRYDSLYQLTEAVYPNKREQFTYDRAGNRLTRTAAREHGEAVREAYTYDNANRLTKRSIYNMTAGVQEIPETPEMADRMYRYTYDRQGNMLSDGDNTYQYDGMNRLKKINTKAGDIQKNHYDGEGLRAELEENGKLVSFLYSDGEAVLEDSEAAGITRYIRGLGLLTFD